MNIDDIKKYKDLFEAAEAGKTIEEKGLMLWSTKKDLCFNKPRSCYRIVDNNNKTAGLKKLVDSLEHRNFRDALRRRVPMAVHVRGSQEMREMENLALSAGVYYAGSPGTVWNRPDYAPIFVFRDSGTGSYAFSFTYEGRDDQFYFREDRLVPKYDKAKHPVFEAMLKSKSTFSIKTTDYADHIEIQHAAFDHMIPGVGRGLYQLELNRCNYIHFHHVGSGDSYCMAFVNTPGKVFDYWQDRLVDESKSSHQNFIKLVRSHSDVTAWCKDQREFDRMIELLHENGVFWVNRDKGLKPPFFEYTCIQKFGDLRHEVYAYCCESAPPVRVHEFSSDSNIERSLPPVSCVHKATKGTLKPLCGSIEDKAEISVYDEKVTCPDCARLMMPAFAFMESCHVIIRGRFARKTTIVKCNEPTPVLWLDEQREVFVPWRDVARAEYIPNVDTSFPSLHDGDKGVWVVKK